MWRNRCLWHLVANYQRSLNEAVMWYLDEQQGQEKTTKKSSNELYVYAQMACGCGSGCDDGAASRLLNITVQVDERDTSIITCFCRHITTRYNEQLSRWASGWMTPEETSSNAYLIFMHITSSIMIRRQETIHCIMRDSKILDALTWYWDTSEEDDVVKLATRWNRFKEKSLGGIPDSQGRLFKPKQRRILCCTA